MNYLLTNPKGVDIPIKKIQTYLYDKLLIEWNTSNIDGYGRVYKNKSKGTVIPEYYEENGDYKEVLLDDSKDAIFFFNVGDFVTIIGSSGQVDCEIIFSVDLTALEGDSTREDEQVRNDVFLKLDRMSNTFTMEEIVKGLNNVYSDFRGIASNSSIEGVAKNFTDMQRFHHFKIKGKLKYTINC